MASLSSRLFFGIRSLTKASFSVKKSQRCCLHISVALTRCQATARTSPEEHNSENKNNFDSTELKLKILEASLQFVNEWGWTKKSLSLGAQSLGLSAAAQGIISDGGADIVHYFNFTRNEKLDKILKESSNSSSSLQTYIQDAIEERLKMMAPFAARWPEAMAIALLPTQLPSDTENLLDLADIIWHKSRSIYNRNWYSRRLALAVAYRACELSFIQDTSTDFENTKAFIERRVETILEIDDAFNGCTECTNNICEIGQGAIITIRNLLGVNSWSR